MEKKQYISNRFRDILTETLNDRADEIMEKITLNLNKEVPFSKPGKSFDYVQERQMCDECGGYKGGEMVEGKMCECGPMYEELKGGQKKLDVAKPYGKLTKDDFAKLRKGVKKHMKEYSFGDDKIEGIKPYGDTSTDSPGKPGKVKNVGFDYQKKVSKQFDDYEMEEGKKFPDLSGDKKVTRKDILLGRGVKLKEDKVETNEKWKGDVEVKHTGEYEDMSIAELNAAIKKQKDKNDKTKEAGKKVSHADRTKMSQLYFAKRAKQGWKGKGKAKVDETQYRLLSNGEFALFTENEIIDMIEKIVNEEKNNIKSGTQPKGMSEYERVHKADKKEEDQYFKDLSKKMKDYLKDMSEEESKYEMKETQKFPTENGGMKKGNRKKYTPSDAVDEYIEAFSYPGQTNLRFDEVKPVDGNIEKYLKGDSTTGNAQVDKDGNALGNVVPSEVGEKFYKNYKENLYGQEQADASYKRQPQPVDQAGEQTESGSLKSKRGKGKKTSQSILDKLDESISVKPEKLNEEFERMQALMGYKQKTQ